MAYLTPLVTPDVFPSPTPVPYVNGQPGVRAHFDKYGNFYFFWGQNGVTARYVSFDYGYPYHPSGLAGLAGQQHPASGSFRTHFNNEAGYGPIQDLRLSQSQCRAGGWDYADSSVSSVNWHNNLQRTGAAGTSGNAPKSTLVTITCTDDDGAKCMEWRVEPQAGGCNTGTAAVADIVKETVAKPRNKNEGYGTYYLPFRLTLKRQ